MWLQASLPCTLAGSRAAVWVGGPRGKGMKHTCLLACLRGGFSEPSSSQASVGRAQAPPLDRLQGSAPHLNSHQGPSKHPGSGWSPSDGGHVPLPNTRILPHRRFPRVNDRGYLPKERACPSKEKAFSWDAQRIDPERKACPQGLRLPCHLEGSILSPFYR